jgi:hypothetical protein
VSLNEASASPTWAADGVLVRHKSLTRVQKIGGTGHCRQKMATNPSARHRRSRRLACLPFPSAKPARLGQICTRNVSHRRLCSATTLRLIPSPRGSNAFPHPCQADPGLLYHTQRDDLLSGVASKKPAAHPALHKNPLPVASRSSLNQGIGVYCVKVEVTRQSHSRPFATEFQYRSAALLSDRPTTAKPES